VFVTEGVAKLVRLLEVLLCPVKGCLRFRNRDSLIERDLGEIGLDAADGGGHGDELGFGGFKLAECCWSTGQCRKASSQLLKDLVIAVLDLSRHVGWEANEPDLRLFGEMARPQLPT
jgi:hypothetical protein